jgi:hypothetical protein
MGLQLGSRSEGSIWMGIHEQMVLRTIFRITGEEMGGCWNGIMERFIICTLHRLEACMCDDEWSGCARSTQGNRTVIYTQFWSKTWKKDLILKPLTVSEVEIKNWSNWNMIRSTGWSKSLCTSDDYSTKHKQKYFKQFQLLTMITYLELGITEGVIVSLVSPWSWRSAGNTLNITCKFLYFNHQVYRAFWPSCI